MPGGYPQVRSITAGVDCASSKRDGGEAGSLLWCARRGPRDELPHRALDGQGRVDLRGGKHPVCDVVQLRGLESSGPVDV